MRRTPVRDRSERFRQFGENRWGAFSQNGGAGYTQGQRSFDATGLTVKLPKYPARLLQVAEAVGTPTYAYDAELIRDRCRRFRTAIDRFPSRLLYAVKANANPALLKIILEEVDGLEVVSAGEVELALRMGVPADRLLFSPNNIADEELQYVARRGILVNVGELTLLRKLGEGFPGSEASVRLNLWVGAGHHRHVVTGGEHSKFGLGADGIETILETAEENGVRIVGIHQHIGSGFENAAQYLEAIDLLLDAATNFPDVRFVNVGGGVGVPYRESDRSFNLDAVSIGLGERLAVGANDGSDRNGNNGSKLTCWFEPGRYLVAESGNLLVRVTAVKQLGRKTFVGTDSGFNHLLRPILYGAYHEVYNLSNPDGDLKTYEIAGNICESGDLFASDRPVQEIRPGDILAIMDTGAYGIAMASHYNMRALPAEVLLDGEEMRQIRTRESYAELVDRHLRETRPRGI